MRCVDSESGSFPPGRCLQIIAWLAAGLASGSCLGLAAGPPSVAIRASDRVILKVPTAHDTLKVIVTELTQDPPDPWPMTVSRVRIEGGSGRVQFADTTDVFRDKDGRFLESFEIAADAGTGAGEPVIRLWQTMEPSFPPGLVDFLYLAIRDGVAVRFRPVVEREPTAAELAIVTPEEIRRDDRSPRESQEVRMFATPAGEAADSVLVTPTSSIVFGRAWVRVPDGCYCCIDRDGSPDLSLERLEVTIDGRHGFVEEEGFDALGMYWVN